MIGKKLFLCMLLLCKIANSQTKEYIFIGHAFGNHVLNDKSLDNSVLTFLKNYKNNNKRTLIFGGDFIQNCNDLIEISNFKEQIKEVDHRLVLGGHDDCVFLKKELQINEENYYEIYGDNLLIFLNTTFENISQVNETIDFVIKAVSFDKKNVLIFTHQVIFSKSNYFLMPNSRGGYELANLFYDKLTKKIKNNKNTFHFITGDVGAFSYMPYAYYSEDGNFKKYSVGLGNLKYNKAIQIKLADNLQINFIDLLTHEVEELHKYSALRIFFYQMPRLIQLSIKENLILSFIFFCLLTIYIYKIKTFKQK